MELKRCARCGSFYTSKYEVCHECVKKDNADLSKLKGYFDEQYESGATKSQIASSTGISARNLNRYLGYEQFSGIYISENASSENEILASSKIKEGNINL